MKKVLIFPIICIAAISGANTQQVSGIVSDENGKALMGKDIDNLLLDGMHPNDTWHEILAEEIKILLT